MPGNVSYDFGAGVRSTSLLCEEYFGERTTSLSPSFLIVESYFMYMYLVSPSPVLKQVPYVPFFYELFTSYIR